MMRLLIGLANGLGAVNAGLLALGRALGATLMGAMVLIILAQVFFRYVVGSALAWPEEASRFCMMWATGLMAATAFRRGGFVSIDMLTRILPRDVAAVLALVLYALTAVILWIALGIAWSEVTGIGGQFQTDSLRVPASADFQTWMKVPKSWMMASLLTGVFLLFTVTLELILRSLATLAGSGTELADIPETVTMGVE